MAESTGMQQNFTPLAHDFLKKERTEDVKLTGQQVELEFEDLKISPNVAQGLMACGFRKPSPVQAEAIPIGKCGYDLLIQSKSGTGKTCVFTVLALEEVDISKRCVQVVILNPVRELAIQNADVAMEVGCCMPGLNVQVFIGGTSVTANVTAAAECHIAVGTPGRISQLLREDSMDVSRATLLILDEADQLTSPVFYPDVQLIMEKMTSRRQMIAASATYPTNLNKFIETLMKQPKEVKIDADTPALIGVSQVIFDVPKFMEREKRFEREEETKARYQCLLKILKHLRFSQAMIFCNYQLRASEIYRNLVDEGFDVKLLSARLSQKDRTESFRSFRWGMKKLIVCTDLCARGLDSETLDMVINFELPYDIATYQHRVGRAGRFGSTGTAINLIASPHDRSRILSFQEELKAEMFVIEKAENLSQLGEDVQNIRKTLPRINLSSRAPSAADNASKEYFHFCVFGSEEEKEETEVDRLTHYTPLLSTNEELQEMVSMRLSELDDRIKEYLQGRKLRKLKRRAREAGETVSSGSEDDGNESSECSSISDIEF